MKKIIITFIACLSFILIISTSLVSAASFSVTVPTEVALHQNSDGTVTAEGGHISNNSKYPAQISSIKFNPTNDWKLESYDKDVKNMYIDTKKAAFNINGKNVGASGVVEIDETAFPEIKSGENQKINIMAKATASSIDINENVSNVVYTFSEKKPPLPKKVSWAGGTDAEIAALVKAADEGLIDLAEYTGWKVGDERVVHHNQWNAADGSCCEDIDVTWAILNRGGVKLDNFKTCNYVIGTIKNFDCSVSLKNGYSSTNYISSYLSFFKRGEGCMEEKILHSMPSDFSNLFKNHIKRYEYLSDYTTYLDTINEKLSFFGKENILLDAEFPYDQFEYFKNGGRLLDFNMIILSNHKYIVDSRWHVDTNFGVIQENNFIWNTHMNSGLYYVTLYGCI